MRFGTRQICPVKVAGEKAGGHVCPRVGRLVEQSFANSCPISHGRTRLAIASTCCARSMSALEESAIAMAPWNYIVVVHFHRDYENSCFARATVAGSRPGDVLPARPAALMPATQRCASPGAWQRRQRSHPGFTSTIGTWAPTTTRLSGAGRVDGWR